MLDQDSVTIARAFIGAKELTGKNDGLFCAMLGNWLDHGAGWMTGQPWCGSFASWCIYLAGLKNGLTPRLPALAGTTAFYEWYKRNGLLLKAPTPYSLGMLRGSDGDPLKSHHHTFFVESISGDFVNSIDGNWNDCVSETRHAISACDFGPVV